MDVRDGGGGAAEFRVDLRVGRVVEARVQHLRSEADADAYSRALGAVVARVPAHQRPVLCADHRPVTIYPPAAADRLARLFQEMNARLERVAIVVARSNATLALQLERIVREAGYVHRRVFYDAAPAVEHVSAVLDAAERERVRAFLAEWTA